MNEDDLLALHVALRGALAQLQTIVTLLMWRGDPDVQGRALLDSAKSVLARAKELERVAPPAPEGTDRRIRGQAPAPPRP